MNIYIYITHKYVSHPTPRHSTAQHTTRRVSLRCFATRLFVLSSVGCKAVQTYVYVFIRICGICIHVRLDMYMSRRIKITKKI